MRLDAQLYEYAYAHSDYVCIGIGFGGSPVVGLLCIANWWSEMMTSLVGTVVGIVLTGKEP